MNGFAVAALVALTSVSSGCMAHCADEAVQHNATTTDHASAPIDARIVTFETMIPALEDRADPNAPVWSISDRMGVHGVPGASVAIIQNGEVVWTQGYGTVSALSGEPVDEETVFSAGSVSKLVNAALILRLVQDGQLDLDEDINSYLTSWQVPESEFTRERNVTLRSILSHTSGFSQHGFPDFEPDETLPTILQTLNGQSPAKHDAVELFFAPGTRMQYSGGGITVSQLVIEDVTGMSYADAANEYVFRPLGMTRSTFESPLPESHGNIARAHDREGTARALPRGYESMPEQAASGLWTGAGDMAIFIQAILGDTEFLSDPLRQEMLTRMPRSWHGLGPRLNGTGETSVFHHGGANNSYQTWVEGHPAQGNGFVVLTNGAGGRMLAYELRIAAERAFDWPIHFPDDFDEPDFE